MATVVCLDPLQTQVDYVKHLPAKVNSDIWRYLERIDLDSPDNLSKAFKEAPPLTMDLVVYRGLALDGQEIDLCYPEFMSTSLSLPKALVFTTGGKGVLLRITLTKGSKILPLYTISNCDEEEILLDRNTQLYITGRTDEYLDLTNQPPHK
jgi:hypothetical protein